MPRVFFTCSRVLRRAWRLHYLTDTPPPRLSSARKRPSLHPSGGFAPPPPPSGPPLDPLSASLRGIRSAAAPLSLTNTTVASPLLAPSPEPTPSLRPPALRRRCGIIPYPAPSSHVRTQIHKQHQKAACGSLTLGDVVHDAHVLGVGLVVERGGEPLIAGKVRAGLHHLVNLRTIQRANQTTQRLLTKTACSYEEGFVALPRIPTRRFKGRIKLLSG
eukprot:1181615-Prorocentrum_minimum.AAC.1